MSQAPVTQAIGQPRLPVGRPGQALAVALVFLLLALVWFAVARPLIDWHDSGRSDLAQRQMLSARMADAAATLPALRRTAETPAAGARAAASLLTGDNDALAGAALQQMVEEMATRNGATLPSIETLAATQLGAYRRIGLRLAVNAPWPVLIRLLLDVEQATPSMLIDDIQIHGAVISTGPGDPPLDAGFSVYAFREGTAAARPSAAP